MTKSSNKAVVENFIKQMVNEEKQAAEDYIRITKEDEDKNYMDILPPEFKTFKRSIIKSDILHYIDKATDFLNQCLLYEGRVFDKKHVVRYMMRGEDYTNFYLARLFVPRKDEMDLWWKFHYSIKHIKYTKAEEEKARNEFRKNHQKEFDQYNELSHILSCLKRSWESYEEREKVRKGEIVHDYDMEKDGYPRCDRGNMCSLFTPIKGAWIKNAKGVFKLLNPRNNKKEVYKILGYKAEDDIYKCTTPAGKTVFLAQHQEIADFYDALFHINKEIFNGWWNKTMILK